MKDYLTVVEYAKLKGISRQAVYQQLNKRLKPYVKTVDGKKVISASVFLDDIDESPGQPVNQSVDPVDLQSTSQVDLTQTLTEQLTVKDQQIEALHQQIDQLHHLLLLAQQTIQTQQTLPAPSASRQSWWSRMFHRKQ